MHIYKAYGGTVRRHDNHAYCSFEAWQSCILPLVWQSVTTWGVTYCRAWHCTWQSCILHIKPLVQILWRDSHPYCTRLWCDSHAAWQSRILDKTLMLQLCGVTICILQMTLMWQSSDGRDSHPFAAGASECACMSALESNRGTRKIQTHAFLFQGIHQNFPDPWRLLVMPGSVECEHRVIHARFQGANQTSIQ